MFDRINPRILRSEPIKRCCLDDCRAACCLHGVWLDPREVKDILNNSKMISPYMPDGMKDPVLWFDGQSEIDPHSPSGKVSHSTVLEMPRHYGQTACVFLRSDHKCALQVASSAAGWHEWRFKPYYCILHPLDLDSDGRITLDQTEVLQGEQASCLQPAESQIPLVSTFEPELRYLLGDKGFEELKKAAGV